MAKLVIVDADASFAESVNHLLQPHGFRAVVTPDGDAAVDLVRNERPDLLLVNVELGRGSGFSLCNRVRRNAELQAIPIILTSSQATPEAFAQHQKLATRADVYLHKPVEMQELLARAQQLVPAAFQGGNGAPAPRPAAADDEVLAVRERGAPDDGNDSLDASLDQALGGSSSSLPTQPALPDSLPPLPRVPETPSPVGGPPPIPRAGSRLGRSARGASLDELLRGGRPDDGPASLPPQAGPEAKQQFLRETLRRREADLARARELWSAREREVGAMEEALDVRTRDLDVARDELRDAQVRLAALEERLAASTAESAILEERVQRMERERDALLQDGENLRDAHEQENQAAEERYRALDAQKTREREEAEALVAERMADIRTLEQRIEAARKAAEAAAEEAHARQMQLQKEKDDTRALLDEEVGTREGVQQVLKNETEERIRVAGALSDLTRAKDDADKTAARIVKELQEKVAGLTRERTELENERDQHLAELAARADQIARLETRESDLEAALTEEQGKVTDHERTLSERHHQIEEQNAELQARAARIQGLETDLERARERITNTEQRLAETRDQAEKDARERSEVERQLREALLTTETTLKERELRIQTLESDVSRLTAALDVSRAERDNLAERLGTVEGALAEEQRGHQATREKLEGTLQRERKAAAEFKAQSDRRDGEQQARIMSLDTELSTTTEHLRQAEQDLAATRTRLGESDRTLRQTRAQLDETAAERDQLRGQTQDYQAQVRRKTENETRLNAELSQAQARATQVEHELEGLQEQFGAEKGELEGARAKLEERARQKITELSEQLAEAKNTLQDLRMQGEANEVQASSLGNELMTLRAERDAEARSRVDAEARLDAMQKSLAEEKDKRDRSERDRLAVRKNLEKLEKQREQTQQDHAAAEARHKVELDSVRGELRVKERSLAELTEAAARDKAAREREKQGLSRTLEDEKRALTGKVEELTRRVERAEARATSAETEANGERTARVKERAVAKVEKDSLQTRLTALEAQAAQGGGGAGSAQLEKALKDRDERIEEIEGELQMVSATLQDASNKNKRLQEEMAKKTVGGAEAAELRKKYNELVTRYKQREDERKKVTEEYQKAMEQLQRLKGAAAAKSPAPRT